MKRLLIISFIVIIVFLFFSFAPKFLFVGNAIENIFDNKIDSTSCMLLHGNSSHFNCNVNSITKENLFVRLKNNLKEEVKVIASVSFCDPIFLVKFEAEEEGEFIFSCNNSEFFDEKLSITYILEENEEMNLEGMITGRIESEG